MILRAKRRRLKYPDGFMSHFYAISEHLSPVLAMGFLGPESNLKRSCIFFKVLALILVSYTATSTHLTTFRSLYITSLAKIVPKNHSNRKSHRLVKNVMKIMFSIIQLPNAAIFQFPFSIWSDFRSHQIILATLAVTDQLLREVSH